MQLEAKNILIVLSFLWEHTVALFVASLSL